MHKTKFDMSHNCYNVIFKLTVVAAAEAKSKMVIVGDFTVDT